MARLGEIRAALQRGAHPGTGPRSEGGRGIPGATFILVLWTNRHSLAPGELAGELFPGNNLNVIGTGASPPAAWDTYQIPGEYHPDARAHARVATLLAEKFRELGLTGPSQPPSPP